MLPSVGADSAGVGVARVAPCASTGAWRRQVDRRLTPRMQPVSASRAARKGRDDSRAAGSSSSGGQGSGQWRPGSPGRHLVQQQQGQDVIASPFQGKLFLGSAPPPAAPRSRVAALKEHYNSGLSRSSVMNTDFVSRFFQASIRSVLPAIAAATAEASGAETQQPPPPAAPAASDEGSPESRQSEAEPTSTTAVKDKGAPSKAPPGPSSSSSKGRSQGFGGPAKPKPKAAAKASKQQGQQGRPSLVKPEPIWTPEADLKAELRRNFKAASIDAAGDLSTAQEMDELFQVVAGGQLGVPGGLFFQEPLTGFGAPLADDWDEEDEEGDVGAVVDVQAVTVNPSSTGEGSAREAKQGAGRVNRELPPRIIQELDSLVDRLSSVEAELLRPAQSDDVMSWGGGHASITAALKEQRKRRRDGQGSGKRAEAAGQGQGQVVVPGEAPESDGLEPLLDPELLQELQWLAGQEEGAGQQEGAGERQGQGSIVLGMQQPGAGGDRAAPSTEEGARTMSKAADVPPPVSAGAGGAGTLDVALLAELEALAALEGEAAAAAAAVAAVSSADARASEPRTAPDAFPVSRDEASQAAPAADADQDGALPLGGLSGGKQRFKAAVGAAAARVQDGDEAAGGVVASARLKRSGAGATRAQGEGQSGGRGVDPSSGLSAGDRAGPLAAELEAVRGELVEALASNSQLQARVQSLEQELIAAKQALAEAEKAGRDAPAATAGRGGSSEGQSKAMMQAALEANGLMARLLSDKDLSGEARMQYAQAMNRILALLLKDEPAQ